MQLAALARIVNSRWGGLFGGVAGATAATVVRRQFSTLTIGREALLVGLLAAVIFLLLVVVTNLAGVLPRDAQGGDPTSGR